MIPSPIRAVLSSLTKTSLRFLVMGGQACILYGAAEFSRDLDIAIRVSDEELDRLRAALDELDAETVYVPPLSAEVLLAGHACHFRCGSGAARGLRLDVMARMRGVDSWDGIWARRAEMNIPAVGVVALLGLPDLVAAKKTQRDKDWPMIRRLVERDVLVGQAAATEDRVRFWLRECRTPELLVGLTSDHATLAAELSGARPAVQVARTGDPEGVRTALREEEESERQQDREYWKPLREQLERWRHEARTRR